MSINTLCQTIVSGTVNRAVRAYRTAKREHLTMELFGEGTRTARRNFEEKLEQALLRRLARSTAKNRTLIEKELNSDSLSDLT